MQRSDRQRLAQLGQGATIERVCQDAGWSRPEFDQWWRQTTQQRAGAENADTQVAVGRWRGPAAGQGPDSLRIVRDRLGIPKILADSDYDVFFGFGWAMAEDRLFQLDWLRRKGQGRLAELLGPDALERDRVARTLGLARIAANEWEILPNETQQLLEAFCDGINGWIDGNPERQPIEFDLLEYQPDRWTPQDSLVIESEFRWYLTGRFPVICIPEIARRRLGEGELFESFMSSECDHESILHPGDYDPGRRHPPQPVGHSLCDPDSATGSNNWVVSGERTTTGAALVASDPHIALEAVSCWYEAHLCGGSFNVAGMAYAGMPAIMFGRNPEVAWGITNNICSLRDLYQERVDPEHPDCFLYDGQWERARDRTEQIAVREGEDIELRVRSSRNGPIVDDILPPPANQTGPVSLKWLGTHHGGWLQSLLAMGRASTVAECREAMRPWHVPTFSVVMADIHGTIGFQASGRIPLRERAERGYRRGWDPADRWLGLISMEDMPAIDNPPRGWIATANNRLAPEDYPRPLSGCWNNGWRARRIRQMLEALDKVSPDDMRRMQMDTLSLRAVMLTPALLQALTPVAAEPPAPAGREIHPLLRPALRLLEQWDGRIEPDSAAATIFNVFFTLWKQIVVQQRFGPDDAPLLLGGIDALAADLILNDPRGWFFEEDRLKRLQDTFVASLELLQERWGGEPADWNWGRLHCMPLRHVLSSIGDLGQLLDHGGQGVRGDMMTVCNSGSGPDWSAASGGGYRMVADLSSDPPSLGAVDAQSQSGRVGSGHYNDQLPDWIAGKLHELILTRQRR